MKVLWWYVFSVLYQNMGASDFHIWKYLNMEFFKQFKKVNSRFELSTVGSLVSHLIRCTIEPVYVMCRWFLYNTKQQEVTGAAIFKSKILINIVHQRFLHGIISSGGFSLDHQHFLWLSKNMTENQSPPTAASDISCFFVLQQLFFCGSRECSGYQLQVNSSKMERLSGQGKGLFTFGKLLQMNYFKDRSYIRNRGN